MTERKSAKPCPVCKQPAKAEHAPFCSKRCAEVDLHRWFSGRYGVPGDAVSEENDSGEE